MNGFSNPLLYCLTRAHSKALIDVTHQKIDVVDGFDDPTVVDSGDHDTSLHTTPADGRAPCSRRRSVQQWGGLFAEKGRSASADRDGLHRQGLIRRSCVRQPGCAMDSGSGRRDDADEPGEEPSRASRPRSSS